MSSSKIGSVLPSTAAAYICSDICTHSFVGNNNVRVKVLSLAPVCPAAPHLLDS